MRGIVRVEQPALGQERVHERVADRALDDLPELRARDEQRVDVHAVRVERLVAGRDLLVVDRHQHEIDVGLLPDGVVRQAAAENRRENRAIPLDLLDQRRERRREIAARPLRAPSRKSLPERPVLYDIYMICCLYEAGDFRHDRRRQSPLAQGTGRSERQRQRQRSHRPPGAGGADGRAGRMQPRSGPSSERSICRPTTRISRARTPTSGSCSIGRSTRPMQVRERPPRAKGQTAWLTSTPPSPTPTRLLYHAAATPGSDGMPPRISSAPRSAGRSSTCRPPSCGKSPCSRAAARINLRRDAAGLLRRPLHQSGLSALRPDARPRSSTPTTSASTATRSTRSSAPPRGTSGSRCSRATRISASREPSAVIW